MAKAETGIPRVPRGTKPVSVAFFSALDAAPEAQRAAIARAAQVMIRDQLRMRREKVKLASARANGKTQAAAKAAPTRQPAVPTQADRVADIKKGKSATAKGKAATAGSAKAAAPKGAARQAPAAKSAANKAAPSAGEARVAPQPEAAKRITRRAAKSTTATE